MILAFAISKINPEGMAWKTYVIPSGLFYQRWDFYNHYTPSGLYAGF